MYKKVKITRIDLRSGCEELEDKVVIETPLTIILNNIELSTLLCSPDKLKELAIGHLVSENFISSKEDIKSVDLNEKTTVVRVETTNQIPEAELDKKRIITSGCGRGQTFYNYRDFSGCQPIKSKIELKPEIILRLMDEFQKKSVIFQETGGVHSAALGQGDKIIAFAEDIGRHNAVDKIVGEVVLKGEETKDKFLLLSGRISSEILIKAARLGVPLIVSRSAPTDIAVKLAKHLNITLVGFARGTRMNVY
ncbi:MAG: formate dehydrogenase accessory sulfurtransferase FdhD [bacterium]|nr:formate dehydrogenase accessory sulfurtransferase FdhD [Candidatus Margulisiibacteriota bacterium]